MKETDIEKKYNLSCHVNCPFFPVSINSPGEIVWEYDKNKVKKRKDPVQYICGYDGHVIKDWTSSCPYNKTS